MMDWKNLRQCKGRNVQEYTQEFIKRGLILGITLYTQETLLKFVGGLHSYLHHTIFMFNPTNLDEVCVKATHIESKGKSAHDKFYSAEYIQSKEGKEKGKIKHTTTVKKGDTKLSCSHCQKNGHDEEHFWKLHLDLKPKWDQHQRGKKKTNSTI